MNKTAGAGVPDADLALLDRFVVRIAADYRNDPAIHWIEGDISARPAMGVAESKKGAVEQSLKIMPFPAAVVLLTVLVGHAFFQALPGTGRVVYAPLQLTLGDAAVIKRSTCL